MAATPIKDLSAHIDLGGTIGVTFVGLIVSTMLVHDYRSTPEVLRYLA